MSSTPYTYKTLRSLETVPNGGIPPSIVDRWIAGFQAVPGNEGASDFGLTSLQSRVAEHPDAFGERGPNLVITGPTSTGKTLAAEMLMANHFGLRKYPVGCIYAVPLKALVTEKTQRFREIFGVAGIFESSSDYQQNDPLILGGRFRIAVVIYEKLYSWLAHRQNAGKILRNSSLLIVDELQMLTEPQRGAKLELILTFVRDYQQRQPTFEDRHHRFRIIGLGPSDRALSQVTQWLNATSITVPDSERPVPLVEGYMGLNGCPHLEPLPPELQAQLPGGVLNLPKATGKTRDELTQNFVVRALTADNGERLPVTGGKRILIYCDTKDGAERMARNLAMALGRRQILSEKTKTAIEGLESTGTLDILEEIIESGVGFHHGDLNLDERLLVESLFTKPHLYENALDVVVSTPTLSMGVNLPADYMLFSTAMTYRQRERILRGVEAELLSPLEYKSFAGRAGRYRPNQPPDHHGVALFLTDRDDDAAQKELIEGLIRRQIDPIEPGLHRWPFGLDSLTLAALAWKGSYTDARNLDKKRMEELFAGTLAGWSGVIVESDAGSLPLQKAAVVTLCELAVSRTELVGTRDERLLLKDTGEAVAREGIDIITYDILKKLAGRLPDILGQPFFLLEELVQAREVSNLYPTRVPSGGDRTRLSAELRSFLDDQAARGEVLGPIAEELRATRENLDADSLAYLMRVVASWLWMQGESAESISDSPMLPGIRYGAVAALTDQLAWYVGALGPIWNALGQVPAIDNVAKAERKEWEQRLEWAITRFERRLRYGLPEQLTSVAHLRVQGWNRQRLMELWDNLGGWRHPVYLSNFRSSRVKKHLRPLFLELRRSVLKREWEDDPRTILERQVSLAWQELDLAQPGRLDPLWPDLIQKLYSAGGRNLVRTIRDALAAKPLEMEVAISCDELGETQREDANLPDLVITLPGPRYVGVVVAGSPTEDLDWRELFQAVNKLGPDGRPLKSFIVAAQGGIGGIDRRRRDLDKAVLITSREAFAQLCVRALSSSEDQEALSRVRTLIEQPNYVLRSAADVDSEVDRSGTEPRVVGALVGRGWIDVRPIKGDSAGDTMEPSGRPSAVSSDERIIRAGLALIHEELDQLTESLGDERDEVKWIREAAEELPALPEMSLVRSRHALESMLQTAYQRIWSGQPDNLNEAIQRLKKKGVLPEITCKQADTLREVCNFAVHAQPRWKELQFEGQSIWVPPDISSRTALFALRCLLPVAQWYLNWNSEQDPGPAPRA